MIPLWTSFKLAIPCDVGGCQDRAVASEGCAESNGPQCGTAIVADHTDPAGAAALHVQPGSTLTLTRGIFAGNANDTNASGSSGPSGTFVGLGTMLAFASVDFVAPGPPSFDYHITRGSPAIDQAIGSTETVDLDGDPRIGTPDIGADEAGAA